MAVFIAYIAPVLIRMKKCETVAKEIYLVGGTSLSHLSNLKLKLVGKAGGYFVILRMLGCNPLKNCR